MSGSIKKLSLVLLILASAYSSVRHLIENIQSWDPVLIANDPISDWEKRLSALRADLPPDVRLVGYLPNLPSEDTSANRGAEYVLTQYAMAPVIVTLGDQQVWVIANLTTKDFETWRATQSSDIKVIEYPRGLFLVHRP